MKKSYSNFTVDDIQDLGLSISRQMLFSTITEQKPSDWLLQTLAINQQVPADSEKAKSELLITPVLNEIRLKNPNKFTYFSGYSFNVDKQRGLNGQCDFILSRQYDAAFISSPLVAVVEAKHNQDLPDATPQCIAEMYAAQLFNEKHGEMVPVIYGVVTNGYEWLFLDLKNQQVRLDMQRYHIGQLPVLLGVWQEVVSHF
jgi:type I site-specific restriction endonuclease